MAFGIAQSLQNMQPAIEEQTGSLPQNLSHLSKLVTLFHLRFGIGIGPRKLYIYAYLEISNWIYNNNKTVRYFLFWYYLIRCVKTEDELFLGIVRGSFGKAMVNSNGIVYITKSIIMPE